MVSYMEDIDHMRKVILKVQNYDQLNGLNVDLKNLGILSYEWIEMPENVSTCVAFGPLDRNALVNEILNKYQVKLF